MHPVTQVAIVGCLVALVGIGGYALTQGVPEYDGRTAEQKAEDAIADLDFHFCQTVRREVNSGEYTVIPGSKAAECFE